MRVPVLVALFGFGAGLFGVALAHGNLDSYRRIRAGAFTAGVADADGGTTITAPLSGEDCLAWAVRVREHSGLFRRGMAPTTHRESDGTTFVVESDTERVRVDPSEAAFDVWSLADGVRYVDFSARERDEPVPDRVAEYATDRELGDPDASRVSEEIRIESGDEVAVFGSERDGGLAVGGPDTVLVDRSGETVRGQVRRRIRAGPAGAALALVSFAAALALASGPAL